MQVKSDIERDKIPTFLGKRIKHKMEDEGNDVWYEGKVVTVLDEDEFDDECEFEVEYQGFKDRYTIQVVKEWRMNCIVVLGSIADKVPVIANQQTTIKKRKT